MKKELKNYKYSKRDTPKERKVKYLFWKQYYYIQNSDIYNISFRDYTIINSVKVRKIFIISNYINYKDYCRLMNVEKTDNILKVISYTIKFVKELKR